MPPQLEDVKTRAENCMKEGKYAEAFFHWTKAIHLVSDKGKKISKAFLTSVPKSSREKFFITTSSGRIIIIHSYWKGNKI